MTSSMALERLGVRKCAVLMAALGQQRAAAILSRLSDTEVDVISAEIARLDYISPEESESVLAEFLEMATSRANMIQGGLGFAESVLKEGLGEQRAAAVIDRLQTQQMVVPFHFLGRADPIQLRGFIADEHPQIVAMVLAHMSTEKSSMVLAGLPSDVQADVAHRLAKMQRTLPEVRAAVEQVLERRLALMLAPTESSQVGGVAPLVEIINLSDRATERQIVEGLEGLDPALADEVKSKMFMFEDITQMEDRNVQKVLRACAASDLAYAMKGVSDALREKVIANMSQRAGEDLLDEIETLGAVRLRQVEEAQQNIIRVIRKLEEDGEITLGRGAEDELVV